METSDYGISGTTEVDPTNPASIAALERLPSASLAAITTDGANRDTGMLTVLRQPKQRILGKRLAAELAILKEV